MQNFIFYAVTFVSFSYTQTISSQESCMLFNYATFIGVIFYSVSFAVNVIAHSNS